MTCVLTPAVRPPVQPSEVKDAWKTLGLDNEEEVIKFWTVGNAAAGQAAADAEYIPSHLQQQTKQNQNISLPKRAST
eukprot:3872671-Rhodomonas_salina.1